MKERHTGIEHGLRIAGEVAKVGGQQRGGDNGLEGGRHREMQRLGRKRAERELDSGKKDLGGIARTIKGEKNKST